MAKVIRGTSDKAIELLKAALDRYEQQFKGAEAALYRQNPGDVHVRIIDDRFAGQGRSRRHDNVWEFLRREAGDDLVSEVGVLILLPKSELKTSLANLEFEDPLPSRI